MEIGSEFWKCEEKLKSNNRDFWNIGKDIKFTLSGRTSIYFILENILLKKNVSKAYLPSYCCDSMIEPFKDLGIEVEYYNVYYDEKLRYNIDLNNDSEIFLAMNYFGYSESNMEEYIKAFSKKGKIIIEDITHSILTKKRYSEYSDYLIGSLRKWFPIASGGIAVNIKEKFELALNEKTNDEMVVLKNKAMENKKKYIAENEKNKDIFLEQYSNANKLLSKEYKNYKIDDASLKIIMGIDLEKIKEKRRANAQIIYENLNKNSKVKFLFSNYNNEDVLLFVPIILERKLRDDLRKYLIKENIYLPVHWPLENSLNNIFNTELSLVCDQRYSKEDIKKYIDVIVDFIGNYNMSNI